MTLGFTSLGLVLVLIIIVPTPLLLRKLSFIAYTCSYAYVVITNLWHLTRGLVTVSCRYLTVFCFHENRQLVVIISCFWGWPFSSVFVVLIVAQHYSHWGNLTYVWIWAFHSLIALCASTLWYKNFISGLRSCENQHQ